MSQMLYTVSGRSREEYCPLPLISFSHPSFSVKGENKFSQLLLSSRPTWLPACPSDKQLLNFAHPSYVTCFATFTSFCFKIILQWADFKFGWGITHFARELKKFWPTGKFTCLDNWRGPYKMDKGLDLPLN